MATKIHSSISAASVSAASPSTGISAVSLSSPPSFISVVLPSYNERENVAEMISRIKKALGKQLLEIIVVDDNSPDGTWQVVEELQDKNVRLMRRMQEKGLASALADGVKMAKGKIIAWLDCDLGLPPEDLPRLVEQLQQGYDVAIGSRYVPGGEDLRPWRRRLPSIMLNGLAMVVLSRKVKDYTSGFVACHREVLEKVHWARPGFGEYFIEFAYQCVKNGFRIIEVGYIFKDRTQGESKSTASVSGFLTLGGDYGLKILQQRPHLYRYGKFLFGGGLSLMLNLAITFLLTEKLQLWHMLSFALALSVEILFLFIYHSLVTFEQWGKFFHFVAVILFISGVNWLGVYVLSVLLSLPYLLAIIVVALMVSILNYGLNRKWVFSPRKLY